MSVPNQAQAQVDAATLGQLLGRLVDDVGESTLPSNSTLTSKAHTWLGDAEHPHDPSTRPDTMLVQREDHALRVGVLKAWVDSCRLSDDPSGFDLLAGPWLLRTTVVLQPGVHGSSASVRWVGRRLTMRGKPAAPKGEVRDESTGFMQPAWGVEGHLVMDDHCTLPDSLRMRLDRRVGLTSAYDGVAGWKPEALSLLELRRLAVALVDLWPLVAAPAQASVLWPGVVTPAGGA